ncbi:MAG TPA: hypothetical protein VF587_08920 [Solirubrobacteraceae bacterium]|jgi:hypothetical protein
MFGTVTHGVHERETKLPYAVERVTGARHLLVTYPRLQIGTGAEPLVKAGKRLGSLHAHRLYVGADEHFFYGPGDERHGTRTAAHLIPRVAARLGVPLENVATVGTSVRGTLALHHGLLANAGLVVAGAPAIRFGYWVKRLQGARNPPTDAAVETRRRLADLTGAEDDEVRRRLNLIILRAANRMRRPVTIDLYTSESDQLMRDSRWFAERLEDHAFVDVRLTVGDYASHVDIADPFHVFARRRLRRWIARDAQHAQAS